MSLASRLAEHQMGFSRGERGGALDVSVQRSLDLDEVTQESAMNGLRSTVLKAAEIAPGSFTADGARFGGTFQSALKMAGIGASAWVLGCSGNSIDEAIADGPSGPRYAATNGPSGTVAMEPGFVPLACGGEEGTEPLYLDDIEPASPVDYLELRLYTQVQESRGAPCSAATDSASCLARFASLPDGPMFVLGHLVQLLLEYQLRATRGDQALSIGTPNELLGFLGEIDSLGDARLVVASRDYDLICGESGGLPRRSWARLSPNA
jgi:hypothetical protein